ncbi:MAG: DNA mismatch repair protein MutL, partial [Nitrospirae bacterium]|nr:DNA mismatch repair protein MutL [Nitrospirota bacterium]
MEPEDARIAFQRHATSTIQKAEDLEGIQTLGFRGEALASIASVSQVVLQTKEKGGVSGALVEISGGRILKVSATGCPEGTDIRVADLFFNVPARKAFLRTPATEFGHILGLMGQFGLAYPGTHFSLIHNDRSQLELPPVASLIERVTQIYGGETASRLTAVSREADGFE